MEDDLRRKHEQLKAILAEMGGLVVAYSGGVDSTLLLKVAVEVLGDRVLAVTATSETYPPAELEEAIQLAQELGARHETVDTDELHIDGFANNPPERCYYCKTELFQKLLAIAEEQGLPAVADGSNVDDMGDYRPGMRAGAELGIRSPLREAGLGKADVRELSKHLGLPTWNKPSFACLASRFPYGDHITSEKLRQVAAAEQVLRGLGFTQVRVRHHGEVARVELEPDEFSTIIRPENRSSIVEALRKIGYLYVTLDLAGYRTGSMNEPLRRGAEQPSRRERH
ncbi:MAG: ATP-dependent sacrificial sulfur transferase LarE [Armatimonadota bacterium]|nr:MAG: ATP-dependent sacrificial sulfur transferase LarE [Armatimonadota bacterium]